MFRFAAATFLMAVFLAITSPLAAAADLQEMEKTFLAASVQSLRNFEKQLRDLDEMSADVENIKGKIRELGFTEDQEKTGALQERINAQRAEITRTIELIYEQMSLAPQLTKLAKKLDAGTASAEEIETYQRQLSRLKEIEQQMKQAPQ